MEAIKNDFKESAKNIANIMFSPRKAFLSIAQTPRWLAVFLILSCISIIFGLINLTSINKIFRIALPSGIAEILINSTGKSRLLTFVLTPSLLLAKCMLFSLLIWLVSAITTSKVTFRKTYSLIFHSGIILFMEFFLLSSIYFIKSFYQTLSYQDFKIDLGLDVLFKNADLSLPVSVCLANINVVNVWWIILMVLGLEKIFNLEKKKSMIIIAIFWFIWLAIQIGIALIFKYQFSHT